MQSLAKNSYSVFFFWPPRVGEGSKMHGGKETGRWFFILKGNILSNEAKRTFKAFKLFTRVFRQENYTPRYKNSGVVFIFSLALLSFWIIVTLTKVITA